MFSQTGIYFKTNTCDFFTMILIWSRMSLISHLLGPKDMKDIQRCIPLIWILMSHLMSAASKLSCCFNHNVNTKYLFVYLLLHNKITWPHICVTFLHPNNHKQWRKYFLVGKQYFVKSDRSYHHCLDYFVILSHTNDGKRLFLEEKEGPASVRQGNTSVTLPVSLSTIIE